MFFVSISLQEDMETEIDYDTRLMEVHWPIFRDLLSNAQTMDVDDQTEDDGSSPLPNEKIQNIQRAEIDCSIRCPILIDYCLDYYCLETPFNQLIFLRFLDRLSR